MGFKDHFSAVAGAYQRFRPTYPDTLFDWLAQVAPACDLAWDCATGSGQAAGALAARFSRVIATDASARQLAQAPATGNVHYRVATAEDSGLPGASADLVCVAQALHWFDHAAFFAEAARVGRPRGVLAAWTYTAADMPGAVGAVIRTYCTETLRDCWAPERALVESGYATIRAPFAPLDPPSLRVAFRLSLETLLGYLGTWSAAETYRQTHGRDPLEDFAPILRAAWPGDARILDLDVPLRVRAWRLPD